MFLEFRRSAFIDVIKKTPLGQSYIESIMELLPLVPQIQMNAYKPVLEAILCIEKIYSLNIHTLRKFNISQFTSSAVSVLLSNITFIIDTNLTTDENGKVVHVPGTAISIELDLLFAARDYIIAWACNVYIYNVKKWDSAIAKLNRESAKMVIDLDRRVPLTIKTISRMLQLFYDVMSDQENQLPDPKFKIAFTHPNQILHPFYIKFHPV